MDLLSTAQPTPLAPVPRSCDFVSNMMCFMFICNGHVIEQLSPEPPDCDVMGDIPKTWSDARLYCRRMGGTISSAVGRKGHLFKENGVTGDLWSGYFIKDLRLMQDTSTTPVHASMNISLWKLTEPVVAVEDQCVSFTLGNCNKQNSKRSSIFLETNCLNGYQFHMTSCQRSLDFVCRIPARRLKSIFVLPSRNIFTIESDKGSPEKNMFFSLAKSRVQGGDYICKRENINSSIFTLDTQADYGILRFLARGIRQHLRSLRVNTREYQTSLFWVKDTQRRGCFALSLQADNTESTSAHVISWPCHARLRLLCAYDIELSASQTPQIALVSNSNKVTQPNDKEVIMHMSLMLQTLGKLQFDPDFRLGCKVHLTSPSENVTIYRNNEAIATFQGDLTGNRSVYYLDEQSIVTKRAVLDKDVIGYYHCEVNDIKYGYTLSSEKLFIHPKDYVIYSVQFEVSTPTNAQLWSVFTLKCLMDTYDGKGLQTNAEQKLGFDRIAQFVNASGYEIKPLFLKNHTLVTYALKRLSNNEKTVLTDKDRALEAIKQLRSFVEQRVSASLHGVTRVDIRSLDWCFPEGRWDNQTRRMYQLPFGSFGDVHEAQNYCPADGEPLVTVECTGDKLQGLFWGPINVNPNCDSIEITTTATPLATIGRGKIGGRRSNTKPSNATVHKEAATVIPTTIDPKPINILRKRRDNNSNAWCEGFTHRLSSLNVQVQVPRIRAGTSWRSPQKCRSDGVTPIVTINCVEESGISEWRFQPSPFLCNESPIDEFMESSTIDTTQAQISTTEETTAAETDTTTSQISTIEKTTAAETDTTTSQISTTEETTAAETDYDDKSDQHNRGNNSRGNRYDDKSDQRNRGNNSCGNIYDDKSDQHTRGNNSCGNRYDAKSDQHTRGNNSCGNRYDDKSDQHNRGNNSRANRYDDKSDQHNRGNNSRGNRYDAKSDQHHRRDHRGYGNRFDGSVNGECGLLIVFLIYLRLCNINSLYVQGCAY
ncbi:LOW QUALITY PROTEIN: collagen-like protein 6 [Plakobranchus ocellatus]|uniref:Collagen-like protein 6 n=1 Tax=Plakobranchus ocellatus TaxID=259542 RepID=A0AAV4C215_9GAST|nr:LOW QUALITY PROTEIN: collagen-like protein 6 [Plakobranchus ocellatus]